MGLSFNFCPLSGFHKRPYRYGSFQVDFQGPFFPPYSLGLLPFVNFGSSLFGLGEAQALDAFDLGFWEDLFPSLWDWALFLALVVLTDEISLLEIHNRCSTMGGNTSGFLKAEQSFLCRVWHRKHHFLC